LHPFGVNKRSATHRKNRHKTNGKQPEAVICPSGQEKNIL